MNTQVVVSIVAFLLQASLGLVLFRLFSVLNSDYRRWYLGLWSASWLALFFFSVLGTGAAYTAILGMHPVFPIFLGVFSLIAGYWHPTLLLLGTYGLASRREVAKAAMWKILLGVTFFAIAVSMIPAIGDARGWIFLGGGVSALIIGLAFTAVFFALRKSEQWHKYRGARTVAWTLLFAGGSQIGFFVFSFAAFLETGWPRLHTVFRLLDVPIYAVLGIGMVIWLLEEERVRRASLEAELYEAQKLELLGKLSGNVAHDFNNLLTVIGGYVNLLKETIGSPTQQGKYLDGLNRAYDRAAALTQQLLAFSRKQAVQFEVTTLATVVTDIRGMLDRLTSARISIEVENSEPRVEVGLDCAQIERVVLNLVINAADSMPAGGTIHLATGAAVVSEPRLTRTGKLETGEYGVLEIRDEGMGMPQETLEHIFDPFFSTKGTGGTGLGLASVFGIVEQHGGHIDVTTIPEQGTTFWVYLPIVKEGRKTISTESNSPDPSGSETVLLIEDQKEVRDMIATSLERFGYTLLVAADQAGAWDIVRSGRPVDALIVDMVLKDTAGPDLAQKLINEFGPVPVVFISGYPIDEEISLGAPTGVLQKPFTAEAVAGKLRSLLRKRQSDAA